MGATEKTGKVTKITKPFGPFSQEENHMKRRQAELDTLRTAIAAGQASGPAKPADAVFDRLEAKYAAQAKG